MLCTNCKNEIPNGSKFCVNCGSKVEAETAPSINNTVQNQQPVSVPQYAPQPQYLPQPQPFPQNYKSGGVIFEGKGGKLFWKLIGVYLLSLITLGIYGPWGYIKIKKYILQNTIIDGKRFDFIGTGGSLWGQILVIALLSVLTIGIFSPWGFCRLQRWMANNTVIVD